MLWGILPRGCRAPRYCKLKAVLTFLAFWFPRKGLDACGFILSEPFSCFEVCLIVIFVVHGPFLSLYCWKSIKGEDDKFTIQMNHGGSYVTTCM
ncbi:unnamed protein product [Prunus brigantina]